MRECLRVGDRFVSLHLMSMLNRERARERRTVVTTPRLKTGLAEMLKGGVIMDVTDEAQARIAEDAGAVAVMALERVPADIRREGGVARMADPAIVERIMAAVSIPVMAKCRIGHFAEARVLEALGVDFMDESEVLTPADEAHHVDKHAFTVPFVCGCRDLGEALRRIGEGAALLRTKGEAGTGNVVEAVRHLRAVRAGLRRARQPGRGGADGRGQGARRALRAAAPGGGGRAGCPCRTSPPAASPRPRTRRCCARWARRRSSSAPASSSPRTRPGARGRSCARPRTTKTRRAVADASRGLGEAMPGLEIGALPAGERLQERGW